MASTWPFVLSGGVVVLVLVAWYHFNRMVTLRNRCTEAWSNVDTELKRRYDLIPNLVETVKGYTSHERGLLEELARARTAAIATRGAADRQAQAERPLVDALDRVLAVAEDYPELRASNHFLELQRELAVTEDRIQAARRFYNANVRDYRNLVRGFPGLLFARLFRFGAIPFFEVEPAHRAAPSAILSGTGGEA